jgi:hypothetical protein
MAGTIKTTLLNGVPVEYSYRVYNEVAEMSFNDSAVVALELEDSLFNPTMEGSITLANNYNYIESEFTFRGDGTDKIDIYLKHKANVYNSKMQVIETKDRIIDQTFTIIEESNYIDDGTQAKNRKTYKFIHNHESLMREFFPYEKRYYGYAGSILKEILSVDLPFDVNDNKFPDGDLLIDRFPEMIIPTIPFRYLDVVYYFLKYYYIIQGDLSEKAFLRLNKKTNKYELLTLSQDFFAKHNRLVYEAFHSGDLVSEITVNPNNPPTGPDAKLFTSNIVSTNVTIPGTAVANTYFMNALVVAYDHIYGSSRVYKVLIRDIREKWKKKFVDVFTAIGGKAKQHLNITDAKTTKEFKVVRLPFEFEHNVNITVADMVTNFTFLNQQMNINVVGDAGREPGTFIDVYKNKNDKSKGDEITLGRWFVTGVRHLKLQNTFRNQIFCSKTYAGPKFSDYVTSRTGAPTIG